MEESDDFAKPQSCPLGLSDCPCRDTGMTNLIRRYTFENISQLFAHTAQTLHTNTAQFNEVLKVTPSHQTLLP